MRIIARAKINWTLDIIGQRPDGYHLMDMLMQPVTLADVLTLREASGVTLTVSGYPRVSAGPENLALRAAELLRRESGTQRGAHIHLCKHIPVGAGMGGGSSDAAGVLAGLNALWQTGLTQAELERLGLRLGADVPFCLRGGLTRTTGIGECLEELPWARSYWIVGVQPCPGLSTREVFHAFHQGEKRGAPRTDEALAALGKGELARLAASLGNVLQPVSQALRPALGEAVAALETAGAAAALMTGSGSVVYGVFARGPEARRAAARLSRRYRTVFVCQTCQESLLLQNT